jgi:hypothetical protein
VGLSIGGRWETLFRAGTPCDDHTAGGSRPGECRRKPRSLASGSLGRSQPPSDRPASKCHDFSRISRRRPRPGSHCSNSEWLVSGFFQRAAPGELTRMRASCVRAAFRVVFVAARARASLARRKRAAKEQPRGASAQTHSGPRFPGRPRARPTPVHRVVSEPPRIAFFAAAGADGAKPRTCC